MKTSEGIEKAGRGRRILIAGGGLGGLTAALALLRKGFDVEVYEQASALGEIGAGVQIAANGTRLLQDLGMNDALERIGTNITGKEIRLWSTGRTWPLIDLGATSVERYGAPYFTLHRADLHEALVAAIRRLKPDTFHLGCKAVGCKQDGDKVLLELEGGAAASGDALIGADGVHSRIRQALFGADRPKFTGCMAWRGLVSVDQLPSTVTRTGGVFWLGPGAHIVHYPVRRGELLNFIGIVNRDDWQVESWTARGTTEECLKDFEGWNDDVHAMVRGIATPYKWALIVREPLTQWTVGRATLLGDACHSTLPLLAQGANMAIEDGYLLARCLEAYADDLQAGLESYQTLRLERTTRIVQASTDQLGRNTHPALSDPALAEQHIAKEYAQGQVVNDRYDWVYGYDATRVAIP
jgi:salicylate hydroxylase